MRCPNVAKMHHQVLAVVLLLWYRCLHSDNDEDTCQHVNSDGNNAITPVVNVLSVDKGGIGCLGGSVRKGVVDKVPIK